MVFPNTTHIMEISIRFNCLLYPLLLKESVLQLAFKSLGVYVYVVQIHVIIGLLYF